MSPALVRLSLLFFAGLSVGLVLPWGYPNKTNDESRNPGNRTVTVRCIVEYRVNGAVHNGFVGGKLPPIDAPMPIPPRKAAPVEVRLPNSGKFTGSVEIILNFYVNPCTDGGESEIPAPQRRMPEAT